MIFKIRRSGSITTSMKMFPRNVGSDCQNNYTALCPRFYQQFCTNASSRHVNITNNSFFIQQITVGYHSLMTATHPNPKDFALQSSLGHAWATACRALPPTEKKALDPKSQACDNKNWMVLF